MNESPHVSPFETIRKVSEDGIEYWSARDLSKILGYTTNYRNFKNAIEKAKEACKNSGQAISDHFADMRNMIGTGKGAKRTVDDVHLSRYACYLLVQNADPSKPIVALGQTYFTIQTRRQEIADELAALPEDQKRLLRRSQMNIYNLQLAETAQRAGVIEPLDFAVFQDHGYMGLYSGLGTKDIHARKGLKKSQQILDHMGSEELADNIFRAAQTDAKLKREQITGKEEANRTHHEVGHKVRQTIKELGGTMPEDLPTPQKSIQQLQREDEKRLQAQLQPGLFDQTETQENTEK
jgi:DNA-damage-inducible protein D